MFDPPPEFNKIKEYRKPLPIIPSDSCKFCGKSFQDIKKHEAICKKNIEKNENQVSKPRIKISDKLTTTEIMRKIKEYMDKNSDIPYFDNYRNALDGKGKNGKFQVKLIRDTIIFLKELKYL